METQRRKECIEFVSDGELLMQKTAIPLRSGKEIANPSIEAILSAAPQRMRSELERILDDSIGFAVEELRFRVGKPAQLITSKGEIILPQLGKFTEADSVRMLEVFCGNSVYSKLDELNCGFLTLRGGSRVGICGAPVMENGAIVRFTTATSFNARIPREVKGCAEPCMHRLVEDGRPLSSIIASKPGVGKTTFLRDCARCFSNGAAGMGGLKVAIADERGELTGGIGLSLDTGIRSDAIVGAPKLISIPMLIRNMSPQVIITDELGGRAEAELVLEAAKCGITVLAGVHAGSASDIENRSDLGDLVRSGIMRTFILKRHGGEMILCDDAANDRGAN